ncbi:aldehyde dehydrogenase (NADP(+)) [Spongiivirga citrea]|uniref:Aldehyde dehydrogenase family protein n=1 Tax=Spongiivirga citrea TaxID=1481457 RepID=A0A6M0CZC0_9FLAO|nr:aldehyde dehydrogenase (NADP(+)) [Spongiivirga citrea]NER19140.1 aldehyde dehydrogenase family protein [Spongiivirga citrea]
MITGKNYIGNDLKAEGTVTFKTFNPKLHLDNNTLFTEASDSEIEDAANLAQEAFKEYAKISGNERAVFLKAIADEIMALGDSLIDTYMSETGLPKGRAQGERGRTVGQLRMFANLVETDNWRELKHDEAIPDRAPAPKPDLLKMLIPIGPIAVFGASNFPLAYSTAGGDTASALASGCPVIVKSHPMHAGTGELVGSAIVKAAKKTGMPNGVFSNLNSKGIEVGTKLVQHPKIKGVGFTGSIKGGRALYDLAAKRPEPIPVFAEMGSINPVIITQNALLKRGSEIATTYAGSITLGAGQFCTNPGLLLGLKSDHLSDFITELGQKTIENEAQCMLHPNIQHNYIKNGAMVSSQNGLEVIAEYDQVLEESYAPSKIVTVNGAVFLENPKLHTEVFGPFSMVVQCDNEAQLLEVIANLDGQLTGTIIAEKEDYDGLGALVNTLQNRVGRIIFNGVPTGVEVCESMTHGGPYPASTDSRFTAVGPDAIKRWARPFSYQDFPKELLPEILKE